MSEKGDKDHNDKVDKASKASSSAVEKVVQKTELKSSVRSEESALHSHVSPESNTNSKVQPFLDCDVDANKGMMGSSSQERKMKSAAYATECKSPPLSSTSASPPLNHHFSNPTYGSVYPLHSESFVSPDISVGYDMPYANMNMMGGMPGIPSLMGSPNSLQGIGVPSPTHPSYTGPYLNGPLVEMRNGQGRNASLFSSSVNSINSPYGNYGYNPYYDIANSGSQWSAENRRYFSPIRQDGYNKNYHLSPRRYANEDSMSSQASPRNFYDRRHSAFRSDESVHYGYGEGSYLNYGPYSKGNNNAYQSYNSFAQVIHDPGPPIQMTNANKGPDGSNLFIFHIPNQFTNFDMYQLFQPYGNLLSVRIMVEKHTGRSRGFGFVSYDNPESAELAIQNLSGYQIGNKRLKVQHKQKDELKTEKLPSSPPTSATESPRSTPSQDSLKSPRDPLDTMNPLWKSLPETAEK